MNSHIFIPEHNIEVTGDSIFVECLFCNKKTHHKISYSGSLCLKCKLVMFDFDSWYDLYNHIKKHYKFERKDVARVLGLEPSTVSNYQSSNIGFLTKGLLDFHLKNHKDHE